MQMSPNLWLMLRRGAGALVLAGSVAALFAVDLGGQAPDVAESMSFFITSTGPGFGGNLGGLAGADAHCHRLAAAVGRGSRLWRAYLSLPAQNGMPPVHARDRIGRGPWTNAKGVEIATSVADLHSDANAINRDNARTERGT